MPFQRVDGSFRDPAGYVFFRNERVFRAIDEATHAQFAALNASGTLPRLFREGKMVETSQVDDPLLLSTLQEDHAGFTHFLEHERLPRIAFPYEWSFSMLADAALLTLEVQLALLQKGASLKDATAYNVQFRKGRPVFIDLGSVEKPRRIDLWFALGQFQRHFLFPLLLTRHRGWDLRSCFLPHLDGLPVSQVAAAFPGLSRWRPGLLMDLTLPVLLERRSSRDNDGSPKWSAAASKGKANSAGQVFNLQRLQKKISKLKAGYATSSVWHDYTATCTYDEATTREKKRLIEAFLQATRPATVLDLGCNTGDYSYLAARNGASVIAADGDHDTIELLYHRLQKEPADILPMVVDLGNPSPAIGYMNRERPAFLDRAQSECVFALALIHHLLVSANFPMAAISDLFASLTTRHLVLEYVPVEDVQFRRLVQYREDYFSDLTLESCLETFSTHFRLLRKEAVGDSGRTLLLMEKIA